ncbi:hypothetical protein Tco_0618895 [Tanacetum coccineum]
MSSQLRPPTAFSNSSQMRSLNNMEKIATGYGIFRKCSSRLMDCPVFYRIISADVNNNHNAHAPKCKEQSNRVSVANKWQQANLMLVSMYQESLQFDTDAIQATVVRNTARKTLSHAAEMLVR